MPLNPGDIAFVQYNADGVDDFAFVPLVDIPANEVIHFTDNGWQASNTFRAGEGILTWTAPGNGVSAGTVVTLTTTPTASLGTVSEIPNLNFAATGDQILAYQGDATSPIFLAALNNEGAQTFQADASDTNTSALPAGLTLGVTAIALEEIDNAQYNGPTTGSPAELLAAINNPDNWISNDDLNKVGVSSFSIVGNQAPTSSGNATFTAINEDVVGAVNTGTAVADLLTGLVTDGDFDALGMAVTNVEAANGTWQYSTNGGATWQTLDPTSESSAVTLGASSLYAPSLETAPASQGQLAVTNVNQTDPLGVNPLAAIATQTVVAGGTVLDTTADTDIYAGYSNYAITALTPTVVNPTLPELNHESGYAITFNMQLLETSQTNSDRAGFSILAVSEDTTKAIEIGFQKIGLNAGRIFAQDDGANLFTAAVNEDIPFDTTAATQYRLAITGNNYELLANGTTILTGRLRDYTTFEPLPITTPFGTVPSPDPYELSSLIFLGDNSTSAQGKFTLSQIAVETETRVRFVPNADYAGDATLQFLAWDATDGTANGEAGVDASSQGGSSAFSAIARTGTVTVNAVNDQPSFVASTPAGVEANSGPTVISNWATFDPGGAETGQTATYWVSGVSNPALFAQLPAVDANGTLTFTAANGVIGSSTFAVQVQDDGGTSNGGVDLSAAQPFSIAVGDSVAPIAIARNIEILLDGNGNATINADDIDNGSSDNVAIATRTVSKLSFSAADLGANSVLLTVTDTSGNQDTASATVTVKAGPKNPPPPNGTDNSDLSQANLIFTFEQYVQFQAINAGISPRFSEALYLQANPDVKAAVEAGLFASGAEHYNLAEVVEGRSLLPLGMEKGGVKLSAFFDEVYYLQTNPDVAHAVAQGIFSYGFEHFLINGLTEGRNPSAYYDETQYLSQNADVKAAVEQGSLSSGLIHYLNFGHRESRTASVLFNDEDYLLQNPDVKAAVARGEVSSGFEHLVKFGAQEGRLSILLYEEAYYLDRNPDVEQAITNGAFATGLDHYFRFGQAERRNPSSMFNEADYLAANSDVAAAVAAGIFSSGMEHYFRNGRFENRALS